MNVNLSRDASHVGGAERQPSTPPALNASNGSDDGRINGVKNEDDDDGSGKSIPSDGASPGAENVDDVKSVLASGARTSSPLDKNTS